MEIDSAKIKKELVTLYKTCTRMHGSYFVNLQAPDDTNSKLEQLRYLFNTSSNSELYAKFFTGEELSELLFWKK